MKNLDYIVQKYPEKVADAISGVCFDIETESFEVPCPECHSRKFNGKYNDCGRAIFEWLMSDREGSNE